MQSRCLSHSGVIQKYDIYEHELRGSLNTDRSIVPFIRCIVCDHVLAFDRIRDSELRELWIDDWLFVGIETNEIAVNELSIPEKSIIAS